MPRPSITSALARFIVEESDRHHGAIPSPSDAEHAGVCARPVASKHFKAFVTVGYLAQPWPTSGRHARGARWEQFRAMAAYEHPPSSRDRNWRVVEGHEAIHLARLTGVPVNKTSDPIQDAFVVTNYEQAERIARDQDPSLLWVALERVAISEVNLARVSALLGYRLAGADQSLEEADDRWGAVSFWRLGPHVLLHHPVEGFYKFDL